MSIGRASNYVIWSGFKICHLVAASKYVIRLYGYMSFGQASKYVIWSDVELCHLVGRRIMSFGRASKYVIWSGVEICHLVGRRIMSFGRTSNYVIWSPHRNMSCKTGPLEMQSTSVSHPSKTDEICRKSMNVQKWCYGYQSNACLVVYWNLTFIAVCFTSSQCSDFPVGVKIRCTYLNYPHYCRDGDFWEALDPCVYCT
jgi:hypothetical protein